jgi:glycosyltransferase involved in cell wall biosynthesis
MSYYVSVITPSFNQGRFIERTIQSVIHQNIPNLEYMVVDGGSNDETTEILKRYQHSLRWISEKDNGQADAINKGFSMTAGEIIGWLNSDDIYAPGAIARVVEFFTQHPEIDMLYGEASLIDENDALIAKYPTEAWDIQRLKKTCYISQPAVFFRRRVLTQHGLLDENLNYCMDYEFWLRLALGGIKVAYMPHVLAGSRIYPDTKTSRSPLDFSIETISMLQKKLGYVPVEWLINNAMLCLKTQTTLRFPGMRFNMLVMMTAAYSSIQWNGLMRGLLMDLTLPKAAIEMLCYKKKVDALKVIR